MRGRHGRFCDAPEMGYEESVRWLRSKLGHVLPGDEPAPKARPPERWLRQLDGSHLGVDLFGIGEHAVDVSELTICIVLQDGRAYVGTIEHQHRGGIILHLLGGRSVRIGFRSIRRASLLGSHTFEERRIVCRRQACGLPAAVFPIAAKTISQDAFSDPAST